MRSSVDLVLFFLLLLALSARCSVSPHLHRLEVEIEALEAEMALKRQQRKDLGKMLDDNNLCQPKQSIQNLLNLAADYQKSFDNEWTETGAVVLPDKKLVICSYPKVQTFSPL